MESGIDGLRCPGEEMGFGGVGTRRWTWARWHTEMAMVSRN